jgi:Bacterial protein of unknown function (DUF885)
MPDDQPNASVRETNRRAFDAWLDEFFADHFARRPVSATFIGVHDHDDGLPDLSPEGMAELARAARLLRDRLAALTDEGLTEAQRHDRLLAGGFLQIQEWEAYSAQFARNPSVWTGEAVFSVISLFQRDAEPLVERVAAAIARMSAIPAFLAQGRATVEAAPVAWTERAMREARAGVAYFGRGLSILAEERGVADPAFLDAAGTARDAFVEHAAWLEKELLRRPVNGVACGREAFDRYLARGHYLPAEQDAAWVTAYAERALATARGDLEARAREIDSSKSWRELLAGLADLHPSVEDYYGAYGRVWHDARHAAVDHGLVTWPDYPIKYVPFPRSDREAAERLYYLFYRCPAPFGRAEVHKYLVRPIEPAMPPEERERRLRATNDAVIKLNHVVHHGGLGHHVQNWHAFRAASRIGQIAGVDCASRIALFCGGTLVEGWACYATELMDEIGFLTPLESLSELQTRLRMAARAVADVALHTGAMTLDEAAAFYEHEAGMPPAAAMGEAVKNSMFPGAAMMYLIGTDAIRDLRQHMQKREGADFTLRAFHDRFLSYGAIPVSLIAASMVGDA